MTSAFRLILPFQLDVLGKIEEQAEAKRSGRRIATYRGIVEVVARNDADSHAFRFPSLNGYSKDYIRVN